jgi:hypothetical protein
MHRRSASTESTRATQALLPRSARPLAIARPLVAVACAAVALSVLAPSLAGAATTPEPDSRDAVAALDGCSTAVPLSPVGSAMNGVVGHRRSTCVGFPSTWLHAMPTGLADLGAFKTALHSEIAKTKHSFLHSSLYYHPEYDLEGALATLNTSLGTGGQLPFARRPVIRFMFGENKVNGDVTAKELYTWLTRLLPPDAATWNVRVAVKVAENHVYEGWNHTKLNIRDGFAVLASSVEEKMHEIAIHMAGPGIGRTAREWFEAVWLNSPGIGLFANCAGEPCAGALNYPAIGSEFAYPVRPVNVFGLRRGWLDDPTDAWDFEADTALFAGMRATKSSAFFLSPGLNNPRTDAYSGRLLDEIARQLANDVDVKLVWGDPKGSSRESTTWASIRGHIYTRLTQLLPISGSMRQAAMCKFHGRDFWGPSPSHAKFYMLDDGFYVGSQNMYPSSIVSESPFMPELDDFGYYVDAMPGVNMDMSQHAKDLISIPAWRNGVPIADDPDDKCHQVSNAVHMQATTTGGSPLHTCSGDFDSWLNFRDVDHHESAKLTGHGTCQSDLGPVQIAISGRIGTDRSLSATISGSINGWSDSTALTGTLRRGTLDLAFSGLEPIRGISYSGTVHTAPSR